MNLGEKQKKITNMNNNNLNNNIKNPLEEMKLHSQEENNNSKLDSMVLNDLQIKPKTEEKPKPFVLVKEKEIKPENKPEFKQENKQEIKQENKQENKHENKQEIKQEIKQENKQEIKLENKQEIKENRKKYEMIKENNANNDIQIVLKEEAPDSQNRGKTHLFKLNEPIQLTTLAHKKSEQEVDTPQGKNRSKPQSSKLDKSNNDDTDSLVIFFFFT